jgi:hypothetical protein
MDAKAARLGTASAPVDCVVLIRHQRFSSVGSIPIGHVWPDLAQSLATAFGATCPDVALCMDAKAARFHDSFREAASPNWLGTASAPVDCVVLIRHQRFSSVGSIPIG